MVEDKIGLMQKDIQYLVEKVDNIECKLDKKYVTKVEFEPIKKLVYGLVGAILLGFLGGLLQL